MDHKYRGLNKPKPQEATMQVQIQSQIQMQMQIEKYVRGELSGREEDELWIEFLASPRWYRYFNTWLHMVSIAKEMGEHNADS